ncbi:MAG: glycerophosphodiester phosphodiesterase [Gemmatimonadales bacterium]|nr:glycerophosphodiester phosphodiesterase [Gemmatimonadales bacterium]
MMARASNPLLDLDARPVIAHRGASAAAPENTLAAFELAAGQGADALELDVRLSADGAAVVIHDPTLDRTTDGKGPVRAQTLVDLRLLDAGAGFSPDGGATFPHRGQGLRVPTLGEVLWAFPRMPVLIEVKEPEAQEAVRRVLVQEGVVERCVVASEHPAALEAFREPPFASAASGPEISHLYWNVLLRRRVAAPRYDLLSVPLRHRGVPVPTRRFVAAAHGFGCPVHVWTINEPATARRLWARGVAGVVTNLPGVIRKARDD